MQMAASMEEQNIALKTAENLLSPWRNDEERACISEAQFTVAINTLCHSGLVNLLEDWFFEETQRDFRERVAPTFWKFFDSLNVDQSNDVAVEENVQCLVRAVDYLHSIVQQYRPALATLEQLPREPNRNYSMLAFCGVSTVAEVVRILIKAVIFTQATKAFRKCIDQFYTQFFHVFHQKNGIKAADLEEDGDTSQCSGGEWEKSESQFEVIQQRFNDVNSKLDEIGMLEQLSGTSITNLIHEQIQQHVEKTCKGNFETAFLTTLEQWLENKVLAWLRLVYTRNHSNIRSDCIEGFKGRLLHFLWEIYASIQIGQLFNIIIEYPESEPAVQDLKTCLEKTSVRGHLVSSLKSALETRLLHPGVNTADILTAYISAIRALRALDPAGVILELVCDPVRKYLRSREDTVRCIVTNLTDDGSNELLEELVKGQPPSETGTGQEEEGDDWRKWVPDPVDADPATASKSRRASDIISMLVN
ncbi:hypothetical protein DPMN_150323, partial [Dreissena polymorpha]